MLLCITLAFLPLVLSASHSCPGSPCTIAPDDVIPVLNKISQQYFYIGAFVDLKSNTGIFSCSNDSASINPYSVIMLEAFRWAIKTSASRLLSSAPVVEVGALAFDTCRDERILTSKLVGFETCKVRYSDGSNVTDAVVNKEEIAGYLLLSSYPSLASSDLISEAVDGVTKPVLSVQSGNIDQPVLSDRFIYITPQFTNQLEAVAAVISSHSDSGHYALVLYADNPICTSAKEQFEEIAAMKDICIVHSEKYLTTNSTNNLDEIARNMEANKEVTFIVLLVDPPSLEKILGKLDRVANFVYLIPSIHPSTRETVLSIKEHALGSVVFEVGTNNPVYQDNAEFSDYFSNLKPGTDNTYLDMFWENRFNCYLSQPNGFTTKCDVTSQSLGDVIIPYNVGNAIEAVDILLRAIESVRAELCPNEVVCEAFTGDTGTGDLIIEKLVSWTVDNSTMFSSSDGGSATSVQVITQMKKEAGIYVNVKVAEYTIEGVLSSSASLVNYIDGVESTLSSTCPDEVCTRCGEVLPTTTSSSSPSPNTTDDPNENNIIHVLYGGYEMVGPLVYQRRSVDSYGMRDHAWVIALGVMAGLGILVVICFEIFLIVSSVRMKNKERDRRRQTTDDEHSRRTIDDEHSRQTIDDDHSRIDDGYKKNNKGSGESGDVALNIHLRTLWLGQLLLFGIFLSYLLLFAYLPVPTAATCGIIRFGIGFCYTLCFAVLMVKLLVLLKSKTSEHYLPGEVGSPNYLDGSYQVLVLVLVIGIQVLIGLQWLIQLPPIAVQVTSYAGADVYICNHFTWLLRNDFTEMKLYIWTPIIHHIISLIYVSFILLLVAFLSLAAHGIVTNLRESLFIAIATTIIVILWIAWQLLAALVDKTHHPWAHEITDASTAFGLWLIVTTLLFTLFLPKVRHIINRGVEGVFLEDDKDTSYYGGSLYSRARSHGPGSTMYGNGSVVYDQVDNRGLGNKSISQMMLVGDTGGINSPYNPYVINADTTGLYPETDHIEFNPHALHLKHPRSEPNLYTLDTTMPRDLNSTTSSMFYGRPESVTGTSRVLRLSHDLTGKPTSPPASMMYYHTPRSDAMSYKKRSKSMRDLMADSYL